MRQTHSKWLNFHQGCSKERFSCDQLGDHRKCQAFVFLAFVCVVKAITDEERVFPPCVFLSFLDNLISNKSKKFK